MNKISHPIWEIRLTNSLKKFLDREKIGIDILIDHLKKKNRLTLITPKNGGGISKLGPVLDFHCVGNNPGNFYFKDGPLNKHLQVNEFGHSGWSRFEENDIPEDLFETFNKNFEIKIKNYFEKKLSKYNQENTIESLKNYKPYIFFALQKINDSSTQFQRFSLLEILNKVTKEANRLGYKVLIKRHPYCESKLIDDLLYQFSKKNNIIITRSHIHDLIENSEFVLCVNSSIGLEALLMKKKVISFAKSEYSDLVNEILNLNNLGEVFDKIKENTIDSSKNYLQLKKRIFYTLFDLSSIEEIERLIKILEWKFKKFWGDNLNQALSLNDEINFSEKGDNEKYILSGFSFQETWGRWLDGNVASLYYFSENFLPNEFEIELFGRGYFPNSEHIVILEVYSNEKLVKKIKILPGKEDIFPIKFCITPHKGVNTITFFITGQVVPLNFDIDFDSRKIGFGISSMKIKKNNLFDIAKKKLTDA